MKLLKLSDILELSIETKKKYKIMRSDLKEESPSFWFSSKTNINTSIFSITDLKLTWLILAEAEEN